MASMSAGIPISAVTPPLRQVRAQLCAASSEACSQAVLESGSGQESSVTILFEKTITTSFRSERCEPLPPNTPGLLHNGLNGRRSWYIVYSTSIHSIWVDDRRYSKRDEVCGNAPLTRANTLMASQKHANIYMPAFTCLILQDTSYRNALIASTVYYKSLA